MNTPHLLGILALTLAALPACNRKLETDDDTAEELIPPGWTCGPWRGGGSHCVDGAVEWCHAFDDMVAHTHPGTDCASLGYECREFDATDSAHCVDPDSSCEAGVGWCIDDVAYTCVDGLVAAESCDPGTPCISDGYTAACTEVAGFDATVPCLLAGAERQTGEVATVFDDVFDHAHLVHLNQPVVVTLPEQTTSYLAFTIRSSGTFAVFLSVPDVLDVLADRNEAGSPVFGGLAWSSCPETWPEYWRADLDYDGDEVQPVPYVIRFRPVTSQEVGVLVMKESAE